VHWWWD